MLVYDANAPEGTKPSGDAVTKSITNGRIDLSGLGTRPKLQMLPDGIAAIDSTCPVPSRLLGGLAGSELTASIAFAAGKPRIAPCAKGAHWLYGGTGKPQRLAIRVEWKIMVDLPVLDLHVAGSNIKIPPLKPFGNKLHVWIFHSPSAQIPETLPPRTKTTPLGYDKEAEHFKEFYHLLACRELEAPRFRKLEIPKPMPKCYSDDAGRGLDVGCIAARATPVPL
jgi:hypothetical protein